MMDCHNDMIFLNENNIEIGDDYLLRFITGQHDCRITKTSEAIPSERLKNIKLLYGLELIVICGFTHIFDCNTILKREELENNINSNIDRINKYSLIKVLLSNGNKNQTNYIMMIDWELSKKISFINSVIENIFGVNIRALSNQNKNRDTFILSTICINPLLFEFEINTTLNLSPVNIHYDYEEEFGNIINIMLDKWSNYLISINKPNDTKQKITKYMILLILILLLQKIKTIILQKKN